MKTATFIVVAGPKLIDSFMKAADLFRAKNLGIVEEMTVVYKEDQNISIDRAAALIPFVKEVFEKSEKIVSFIHLKSVRNNNVITLNDSVKPYYDEKIREVSNGHTSFVFKEFIEKTTGFKCNTDQNYFIKEIV